MRAPRSPRNGILPDWQQARRGRRVGALRHLGARLFETLREVEPHQNLRARWGAMSSHGATGLTS